MSATSFIKYVHLALFSTPRPERAILRNIRKLRAGHLVQLGVGDGALARRMIELAASCTSRNRVRFTGIDLFELRPAQSTGMPLLEAYRLLRPTGARIQLIPGDPFSALARRANMLTDTDLVVVQADQDPVSLERAWFYLPRMLHDQSLVLLEEKPEGNQPASYRELDTATIQALAASARPRRRAA